MWELVTKENVRFAVSLVLGVLIVSSQAFLRDEPNLYLLLTGVGLITGSFAMLADSTGKGGK